MTNTINVGIAGLGAIGMPVARWLDAGVAGLNLCGVSSGNKERAVERVSSFTSPPPVLELQELVSMSDVVVEALPPKHFDEVADLTLAAGKKLIVLTLTSLLPRLDLVDKASNTGGQIIAATGAAKFHWNLFCQYPALRWQSRVVLMRIGSQIGHHYVGLPKGRP